MSQAAGIRIGIDLGGTKIEIIALDAQGETRLRERVPTPQNRYQETVQSIVQLVTATERKLGARATVGIGIPGSPSPANALIRNANSTCLNGKPLQRDLESALERNIALANDADCFVLSEAVDGAGTDAPVVFGVIVGTGTGGGIAINRQLLAGCNAIAGEWGHNPLPWPTSAELPGNACYCGKHGCIETWLSGPGFERGFHAETGRSLTAAEIVCMASKGEEAANQALDRYIDRMARALASVINVIDPHCIVLGGGMSNISVLYDEVPARWERYVFSDTVCTRLLPPFHGDSSGVRGAAWLIPDRDPR